ncbi:MAG: type II toxin-antitoxin system VapC family toxin [Propionibacteriaceae bacterium]|nr:type II toxin-antitoxin system VapC family toxin [Propionibacteriaceae bacterium]
MTINADLLLLDTSAALALVQPDNPFHDWIAEQVEGRAIGLSGHANFEVYSVLTRLPMPYRISGDDALRLIRAEFPEPRFLGASSQAKLLEEFRKLGLAGGQVYDALVAAAAREHGLPLLTCDKRAEATYLALGVEFVAP